MTAHESEPAETVGWNSGLVRRSREIRLALGCLVIGMSVVGLTVFWARAVTGGGLDIGAHYLITNWIMEHWNLPSTDPALQGFSDYPAGSHFLAAVIGKVVGSPILGLQLAAFGAITTVWLATASILAMYPRTKRYLALGFLALLILLNSPVGPFSAQGFGFELVTNYFYSQAVGQALFAIAALWVVFAIREQKSYFSSAVPVAVAAVMSSAVHVVTSLELLALLGLLSLRELWTSPALREGFPRLRRRSLSYSVVGALLLPLFTLIIVVMLPGVRYQAGAAADDGYLELPYLPTPGWVGALAFLVLVISAVLVATAKHHGEASSKRVTVGIAILGASIALPAFALWCDFEFVGGAGPYAVKKMGYGLATALALQICAFSVLLIPAFRERTPRHSAVALIPFTAIAVSLVTGIAMWSVYSENVQRRTSELVLMEEAFANNAAALESPPGTLDIALDLSKQPGSFWGGTIDYLFTVSALHGIERGGRIAEAGAPGLTSVFFVAPQFVAEPRLNKVMTRRGSQVDIAACRVAPPVNGFVVLWADCLVDRGKNLYVDGPGKAQN